MSVGEGHGHWAEAAVCHVTEKSVLPLCLPLCENNSCKKKGCSVNPGVFNYHISSTVYTMKFFFLVCFLNELHV